MRRLKRFIWNTSPLALFIIETKESLRIMEKINKLLNFENSMFVETNNGKGGLAFFWSKALGWKVTYKSSWILVLKPYLLKEFLGPYGAVIVWPIDL